jgi:arylsulfatase A-like enzyme
LLSALEKKKVRDSTDIFVVSDHGFSTIRRSIDVVALLNKAGFHAAKEFSEKPSPGDILVSGNAGTVLFYVRDHDRKVTQRLVDWLEMSNFAGILFTRDKMGGTFTFDQIRIDTPDSPDVVMAFRSSEEKNQFGVAGMIDADWNRKAGEGTHATLGHFDVNNTLVAEGPDFRRGSEALNPTGNVDIAPTILAIFATNGSKNMDGRRLDNGMDGRSEGQKIGGRNLDVDYGTWRARVEITTFGGSSYLEAEKPLPKDSK